MSYKRVSHSWKSIVSTTATLHPHNLKPQHMPCPSSLHRVISTDQLLLSTTALSIVRLRSTSTPETLKRFAATRLPLKNSAVAFANFLIYFLWNGKIEWPKISKIESRFVKPHSSSSIRGVKQDLTACSIPKRLRRLCAQTHMMSGERRRRMRRMWCRKGRGGMNGECLKRAANQYYRKASEAAVVRRPQIKNTAPPCVQAAIVEDSPAWPFLVTGRSRYLEQRRSWRPW